MLTKSFLECSRILGKIFVALFYYKILRAHFLFDSDTIDVCFHVEFYRYISFILNSYCFVF